MNIRLHEDKTNEPYQGWIVNTWIGENRAVHINSCYTGTEFYTKDAGMYVHELHSILLLYIFVTQLQRLESYEDEDDKVVRLGFEKLSFKIVDL